MRYIYTVSYVVQEKDKFFSRILGIYPNKEQAYRDACVLFVARNDNGSFFERRDISMKPYITEAQRAMNGYKPDYQNIFNGLQKELCTIAIRGELTPGYTPRHCWITISQGVEQFPDQVISMVEISLSRENVEMELTHRKLVKPY